MITTWRALALKSDLGLSYISPTMNHLPDRLLPHRLVTRPAVGLAALVLAALTALAWAAPFDAPVVNGVITVSPDDWAAEDLVVDDIADDNLGRTANVRRLWMTWSADSLYVGVSYQDIGVTEALTVYLDTDRGVGPGSAAGLDSLPGDFELPDGHRFELVLGRTPDQQFPGFKPRAWRVDDDQGGMTPISGVVAREQGFTTSAAAADEDKARFAFWLNAEFGIPWSQVYPELGGGVPQNAVIKAVALVNRSDAGWRDAAPSNPGVDGLTGAAAAVLQNLHASVIDIDGDGAPDPSASTLSGAVTLPGDTGEFPVRVRAELLDFAGRPIGAPLSRVTTAAGVRDWTLPRLPGGRYLVTTTVEGYVTGSIEIDVPANSEVVGADQTLVKATAIGGTVTFNKPEGAAGTLRLLDAAGDQVATRSFPATPSSFTFYVETGGEYTITAEAPTYLTTTLPVSVTTGVDQDVEVLLVRKTEISGDVSLVGGPLDPGQVDLYDAAGDLLDDAGFPAGGGPFRFFVDASGDYRLFSYTSPPRYVEVDTTLTVELGTDVTGLDFVMPVKARVSGAVAFEGPDAAGRWSLFRDDTGAKRDTLSFAAAGDSFSFYLEQGRFRLTSEAAGYVPRDVVFEVSPEDTSLGDIFLTAVRATHLEIVDDTGRTLPEARATYYDPLEDPWTSTRVLLAARDDAGRDDLYDLDGELTGFQLSALKMDDQSPPTGTPVFYSSDQQADVTTAVDFAGGRATFWMSDTAVEVLRVYLRQPGKAPQPGRIIVAFQDPEPATVVLTADRDTFTADGSDAVVVHAQLYDSAGNPALQSNDDAVTFSVVPGSGGVGVFEQATVFTIAGETEAVLTATGAGALDITATVVVNNRTLDVVAGDLEGADTTLKLIAVAGPTAAWDLKLPGSLGSLSSSFGVQAQLNDALGNLTVDPGYEVTFTVEPADMGSFSPATVTTDTLGRAVTSFVPAGRSGLVTIRAAGSGLAPDEGAMQLRDVQVVTDPAWPDELRTRQTFDKTDLTALIVDNTADELLLEVPFSSDWNGLQMHVIFEADGDAAGAGYNGIGRDPFEQPVNYGHDLKPDYALTTKYSGGDEYGDFRRWDKTAQRWDFWDLENEVYGQSVAQQNIQFDWISKLGDRVVMRVPFTVFGGRPESLRLELYLTQEDGDKRSAFDSAPQDSTLNLTFDYNDPQPGDWASTTNPVTLVAWSDPYPVKTDFPDPPVLSDAAADPVDPVAGGVLTLTVTVADGGDGVGDVLADLSELGGAALTRMHDDGPAGGHFDAVAGDGQFTLRTVVPVGNPGGAQAVTLRAYDATNAVAAAAVLDLDVTPIIDPIIQASDPVGDDHGPNQPGSARKFVTYPTNSAFVAGAFDLTGLTVYETTMNVAGSPVDMIAFQVALVDFPDPDDPGTADWNPLYGQLNIEKIDILIDSGRGGATASLPYRQAAFLPHDAWDYAVIMDGWYKAVIPSRGQNTLDSWRENAQRTDRDIQIVGDPQTDLVTAFVSKAALGDPTPEDIAKWDIAVLMSSHDFGGEEVLGGIRWINESRSEWNFGGGDNSDRDANIVDLMLIPGQGHSPGKTQEELLDYETATALERLDQGLTAVALEMSAFEDTGPPVIDTGGKGSVVTVVDPLADAPVVVAVTITDDYLVDRAVFRYRSTGTTGGAWDAEAPMGFLGRDLWVVDILPDFLETLTVSPIDGTRYLEFEVQAWDALDKEATSPVTTLQINPTAECRPADAPLATADLGLLQVDGSALLVDDDLRLALAREHMAETWTGGAVAPDSAVHHVELQWDICTVPDAVTAAPSVPPGRALGVFREIFLATADTLGGRLDRDGELPGAMELSLHFPEAWFRGGDKDGVALYEYTDASGRWVLVGGKVNATGNNVTATVNRTGRYGLFTTAAVTPDPGEVLSGIVVSPNPFSPNGDGVYDQTNISFYLTQEATVTVEIYNIEGSRKRILAETFSFAGDDLGDPRPRRVPGLIWDGRDTQGNLVPYGIYIMRVIATYNQAGGTRTIRSNHSVAVIR